jgi:hypothetical protein
MCGKVVTTFERINRGCFHCTFYSPDCDCGEVQP